MKEAKKKKTPKNTSVELLRNLARISYTFFIFYLLKILVQTYQETFRKFRQKVILSRFFLWAQLGFTGIYQSRSN